MYENILVEERGPIGIITLNRPKKLNALNTKVIAEIKNAFTKYGENESIRVIIVTGGEKVFGAGADIDELTTLDVMQSYQYSRTIQQIFYDIENFPKPVIAAIAGYCLGGALELALSCDIRIATEKARLGVPEINLGLFPGAGGTQRLARFLSPGWAKFMLYTGQHIKASLAYQIGLVQKVVPEGEVLNEALKLAEELASKPGVALSSIKNVVNTGVEIDITKGLVVEARGFGMLMATEDFKEGTSAFVEKRKAQFKHR